MFSRTVARWLPLAESQRLLQAGASSRGDHHPASALKDIVSALAEHHQTGGLAFTTDALHRIVCLDNTPADSQVLADCIARAATCGGEARGERDEGEDHSLETNLMVRLMRCFPNSTEVRECCCRCIANMCQLTLPNSVSAGDASSSPQISDLLVRDGAVEHALGTLSMATRLSAKGRCWAALAVLNLVCLSRDGATRAASAGAEEVLSDFLGVVVDDIQSASAGDTEADSGGIQGISQAQLTMLDAAMGALARILTAEAAENAAGASFNFHRVHYNSIDAVVRTLLLLSLFVVRDGRNNGAYTASLPTRRYGAVSFLRASPTQQQAVMTLLPLVHKGWMALRSVCEHEPNRDMVSEALFEAACTDRDDGAIPEGGAASLPKIKPQYAPSLTSLLEAALFLVVELEDLEGDELEEVAQLQAGLHLLVMSCLSDMTMLPSGVTSRTSAAVAREDGGPVAASPAPVMTTTTIMRTEAASAVMDGLAAGTVSHMALATVVRVHLQHDMSHHDGAPYSSQAFQLLSHSLRLLNNLSELGDDVATSSNTVAALQAMLKDCAESIAFLPQRYGEGLADLFRPTEAGEDVEGDGDVPSGNVAAGAVSAEDRLMFLQRGTLVGQMYAVLWSVLRTTKGVGDVAEIRMAETVLSIQSTLQSLYQPAVGTARQRYACAGSGHHGIDKDGDGSGRSKWVPNTAEETVERLVRLGQEMATVLQRMPTA